MNFRQYSKLYKWLAWGLTGFIVAVICYAVILAGDSHFVVYIVGERYGRVYLFAFSLIKCYI